jgi:hypothetical protein
MGSHEDILLFEMKLQKLKVEYEQYFCGVIKIPPFKLHEEVKRAIRLQSGKPISNTSLQFKYNSLVGRYTSYNTLWTRQMRQLEDGTLKRGTKTGLGHVKPTEKPPTEETPAEKLYKDYMAAQKSLHSSGNSVTVKGLQAMINKQTTAIQSKYKCSSVEYKVVTENGKAKIKAIPKK